MTNISYMSSIYLYQMALYVPVFGFTIANEYLYLLFYSLLYLCVLLYAIFKKGFKQPSISALFLLQVLIVSVMLLYVVFLSSSDPKIKAGMVLDACFYSMLFGMPTLFIAYYKVRED